MKVNLKSIIYMTGKRVDFDFEMDLSDLEFNGVQPIVSLLSVSGFVRNEAGVLHLMGEAKASLNLSCDRCTAAFNKKQVTELDFILATEIEGEDEEDIVLLEDDSVDVGDLAYSAFILDMDTKNLCSENCLGLCPTCGVNLNEEACRCEREVDPRWEALKQLLDKPE